MVSTLLTTLGLIIITSFATGIYASYMGDINLSSTNCDVSSVNTFEIVGPRYFVDLRITNNGDNLITNYEIESSNFLENRDVEIYPGQYVQDEFYLNDIDDPTVIITAFTRNDFAKCVGELTIG